MAHQSPLRDVLDLADLLTPAWVEISERIPPWHPRCEDPPADPDPKDPPADPPADPDPKDPADPDPDPDPEPKEDWKSASRKHERRAKTEKQRADELQAKLDKIAAENLSENEKALKAAREEAAAEVTTRYEAERRQDRLELATTRIATKGVKVGDDTVKFADPDDALAHLERAIKRGDIDGDEIFGDDGRVDSDALTAALAELLEEKPHLQATNGNGRVPERKGAGDIDSGKGKGAGKSLEEMTPDDHLLQIQGRK